MTWEEVEEKDWGMAGFMQIFVARCEERTDIQALKMQKPPLDRPMLIAHYYFLCLSKIKRDSTAVTVRLEYGNPCVSMHNGVFDQQQLSQAQGDLGRDSQEPRRGKSSRGVAIPIPLLEGNPCVLMHGGVFDQQQFFSLLDSKGQ